MTRKALTAMNAELNPGERVFFLEGHRLAGQLGRFIGLFRDSGYLVPFVAIGEAMNLPRERLRRDVEQGWRGNVEKPWLYEIASPRLVAEAKVRLDAEYQAQCAILDDIAKQVVAPSESTPGPRP